jgi:hypothetical protein
MKTRDTLTLKNTKEKKEESQTEKEFEWDFASSCVHKSKRTPAFLARANPGKLRIHGQSCGAVRQRGACVDILEGHFVWDYDKNKLSNLGELVMRLLSYLVFSEVKRQQKVGLLIYLRNFNSKTHKERERWVDCVLKQKLKLILLFLRHKQNCGNHKFHFKFRCFAIAKSSFPHWQCSKIDYLYMVDFRVVILFEWWLDTRWLIGFEI